jgi:hypothetical protein
VLAENSSSSCTSLTAGRRKFNWCKDLTWLSFDKNTEVENCKVCASFPRISDQNSKTLKGFPGPFRTGNIQKARQVIPAPDLCES